MNIQNLWFEDNKEKNHKFLSEKINFHNQKIAIRGVLISSDWSSLIRVIAVEKNIGPTHRAAAKTLQRRQV